MDTTALRSAYEKFFETAARPDLGEAADGGWNADQVLAHMLSVDAGIAAVALSVVSGARPTFDNRISLDGRNLKRIIAGHGRAELIARVRSQAAVLCDIADRLGPPSVFTCPECGGSLWELREGELLRYQCHVGHRFSGESLIDANSDGLEAALWTALRALQESSALRRRMAKHARNRGMSAIAESYEQHARESDARAMAVRRILVADPNDKEYKNPGDR